MVSLSQIPAQFSIDFYRTFKHKEIVEKSDNLDKIIFSIACWILDCSNNAPAEHGETHSDIIVVLAKAPNRFTSYP